MDNSHLAGIMKHALHLTVCRCSSWTCRAMIRHGPSNRSQRLIDTLFQNTFWI